MRKLAVLGLFISLFFGVSAQENQLNIYLGPSMGRTYGGMINLDYEIQMLDDNLTIGPSLGIGTARYNYYVDNNMVKRESYMILNPAVVAHYYFDWLIPNMDTRFDVFTKAKLGWRMVGGNHPYSYSVLDLNLQVGGRYNFSDKASIYLALGYAYAPMNLGVSIRL